jgi:hypothetical protein
MMTMEQVKAEQQRLAKIEYGLLKLNRIKSMERILKSEHCLISLGDATSAVLNSDQHVTMVLIDAEQEAVSKSIQAVLEIAKQRIEKEIENV